MREPFERSVTDRGKSSPSTGAGPKPSTRRAGRAEPAVAPVKLLDLRKPRDTVNQGVEMFSCCSVDPLRQLFAAVCQVRNAGLGADGLAGFAGELAYPHWKPVGGTPCGTDVVNRGARRRGWGDAPNGGSELLRDQLIHRLKLLVHEAFKEDSDAVPALPVSAGIEVSLQRAGGRGAAKWRQGGSGSRPGRGGFGNHVCRECSRDSRSVHQVGLRQ